MNSCLRRGLVFAGVLLLGGCSSKQTPDKQMIGLWTGAPNVKEATDKAVDAAAQGKEVNPIVRGLAKFGSQALANATLSIEVDFKQGGKVFFRGNTDLLGLPKDSDGTWSASGDNLDEFDITFGTAAKQLHGKVLFRNSNEFTLKLDEASLAAVTPAKQAKEEAKETSKDGAKDAPKDGSKDAAKSAPKPPEFDLASIVFKRNAN